MSLPICLLGMPGVGKSSIGKSLSKLYKRSFKDLDKEISKMEGHSISEIFELKGADYFRDLEQKTLENIIKERPAILAVGGGAPCFFDNMQLINKHFHSVYLFSPLERLHSNLKHKKDKRPLLAGKNDEELFAFLKELFEQREPFYLQAHTTFDIANKPYFKAAELLGKMLYE